MKTHYRNLNQLVRCDRDAERFFTVLPDGARERLMACGGRIRTLAALREYAVNIMKSEE